jgi:hypothetical protein
MSVAIGACHSVTGSKDNSIHFVDQTTLECTLSIRSAKYVKSRSSKLICW